MIEEHLPLILFLITSAPYVSSYQMSEAINSLLVHLYLRLRSSPAFTSKQTPIFLCYHFPFIKHGSNQSKIISIQQSEQEVPKTRRNPLLFPSLKQKNMGVLYSQNVSKSFWPD